MKEDFQKYVREIVHPPPLKRIPPFWASHPFKIEMSDPTPFSVFLERCHPPLKKGGGVPTMNRIIIILIFCMLDNYYYSL